MKKSKTIHSWSLFSGNLKCATLFVKNNNISVAMLATGDIRHSGGATIGACHCYMCVQHHFRKEKGMKMVNVSFKELKADLTIEEL